MPVAGEYARSRFLQSRFRVSTAPASRERTTAGESVGELGLALPAAKLLCACYLIHPLFVTRR
jgi:hypothetical protein